MCLAFKSSLLLFMGYNKDMKKTVLTFTALVSLLICGCNILPTPKKKTSTSVPGSDTTTQATTQSSGQSTTGVDPTDPTESSDTSTPTSSTTTTSSTTPTPPDPGDYYAECEGLEGTALASKLYSINQPKNPSYDWERYEQADEALDDSSSILSLYTRHNIPKSGHCGTYSWETWNREHIWTQTLWPKSKTDNHNIFACEGQINGYRSDLIFDEGGDVVTVFGHTTGCKMVKNTSFEPCDEAKGEVARAVMYGAVMYEYDITKEIKSVELALKWHLEHPITERDVKRNEVVYGNQGNRNPFVDKPSYACKIYGSTNSTTKQLCGLN